MPGSRARTHPRRTTARSSLPRNSDGGPTLAGLWSVGPGRSGVTLLAPRLLDASPRSSIVAASPAAPRPRCARARGRRDGGRRLPLVQPRACPRWRRCATTSRPRSPRSPARTARSAPSTSCERRTLVDIEDAARRTCATPSSPPRTPTSTSTRASTTSAWCAPASRRCIPGGRVTGASTITQQACRRTSCSRQERTLAPQDPRVDPHPAHGAGAHQGSDPQPVPEPDLLRARRYGVEEAALYYFGKHAKDLSIGEAAVLAGHGAAAPAHQPGHQHGQGEAARQRYVLGQMAEARLRSRRRAVDAELDKPDRARARGLRPPVGPYYAEEIRRMLVARYGDDGGAQRRPARGHRDGPEAPGARRRRGARGAGGPGPAHGLPGRAGHAGRRALRAASAAHRQAPRGSRPAAEGRRATSRTSRRSPRPEAAAADDRTRRAEERPDDRRRGERGRAARVRGRGAASARVPPQSR